MKLKDKDLSIKRVAQMHKPGYKFSVEKRIEVVTKCLALGNMSLVAELTGVSYPLIRKWKCQPWWAEMVAEIEASRKAQVNTKLNRIIEKSLAAVEDRIENGDFKYNAKEGTVDRVPVNLKDATKTASDLMQRHLALVKEENQTEQKQETISVADQLKSLAEEFAKFNTKRTVDVVAVDITPKEN